MAHFYFHLLNDVGSTRDQEGQGLPDLAAARDYARQVLAEVIGEELAQGRSAIHLCVTIEDDRGRRLADVKAVTSVAIEEPPIAGA